MENQLIRDIIASLDNLSILELRDLTGALSEKYASAVVVDEAELREKEAMRRAYWTPFYSLILIRIECEPDNIAKKMELIRALHENIPGLGLKEAKSIVENQEGLPMPFRTVYDEYPSDIRRILQPVREMLENLGAVFDEEFNYGYFD